jgi:spore germination cell wall hydrolase CwlJ-like protein
VRRAAREWLWFLAGMAAFALAAIAIGLLVAYTSPAHGAPPRCAPPDPAARPVIRLARGELRALAALAWAETRGEPDPYCSALAVSAVVVNRMQMNPEYFGATITQVITKPAAFSPFGKADPNRARMAKVDESDAGFITALLAAVAAVSGADPTVGADHFHSGKSPRWSRRMVVTARIGGHTFMRSSP